MKRLTQLERNAYARLSEGERSECLRRALESLPDNQRAEILRQADAIQVNLQLKRRGTITGLGIGGALTILAQLGGWLDRYPEARLGKWDEDDLKPEERR